MGLQVFLVLLFCNHLYSPYLYLESCLQEEFEEHAKKIMTLTEEPSNDDKLILYGLFKQASFGPVTTGLFNLLDRKPMFSFCNFLYNVFCI